MAAKPVSRNSESPMTFVIFGPLVNPEAAQTHFLWARTKNPLTHPSLELYKLIESTAMRYFTYSGYKLRRLSSNFFILLLIFHFVLEFVYFFLMTYIIFRSLTL